MVERPGVALVSAGPGFLAGLTGVAVAASMELPLLYLSGASPISQRGIGAFQDLDQKRIAGAVRDRCTSAFRQTC
jgi:thiamine pyrophosphate-dependent acetolactate synthase large subunit-like protein